MNVCLLKMGVFVVRSATDSANMMDLSCGGGFVIIIKPAFSSSGFLYECIALRVSQSQSQLSIISYICVPCAYPSLMN